jgi:hypothetical protein
MALPPGFFHLEPKVSDEPVPQAAGAIGNEGKAAGSEDGDPFGSAAKADAAISRWASWVAEGCTAAGRGEVVALDRWPPSSGAALPTLVWRASGAASGGDGGGDTTAHVCGIGGGMGGDGDTRVEQMAEAAMEAVKRQLEAIGLGMGDVFFSCACGSQ